MAEGVRSIAGAAGVTLVELMIVIVIGAILLALAVPDFTDLVRNQGVRSTTSDLVGEFAYARAEAIRYSRRVVVARAGTAACAPAGTEWQQGWCIYVDDNGNGAFDAGEPVLRVNQGRPAGQQPRLCTLVADFATRVIFRPDGRVARNAVSVTPNDGFVITNSSGGAASTRTRLLLFGLTGRVTVVVQDFVAPPC